MGFFSVSFSPPLGLACAGARAVEPHHLAITADHSVSPSTTPRTTLSRRRSTTSSVSSSTRLQSRTSLSVEVSLVGSVLIGGDELLTGDLSWAAAAYEVGLPGLVSVDPLVR